MKKTYFGVIFVQRKFFLKTQTKCNYSGSSQHLNFKATEMIGYKTKNDFITVSMQKSFSQSAKFIKSFVRYN